MEIRIGVADSPKEISLEVKDSLETVTKRIEDSLAQDGAVLWLVDEKGKTVGVPAGRVAYVEIETESAPRSVGFHP